MMELLYEAVQPANLIYTILLGLAILYALTVVIGVLDMEAFDIDIDVDADVDIDTDVDTDVEGGGFFVEVLSFFNLGRIPFMIIYSITSLLMWMIGMISNHYLGGNVSYALMLMTPITLISLIITKVVTTPLIPAFKSMKEGVEPTDYIGLKGELLLPVSPNEKSQIEVIIDGDVHRIAVAQMEGDEMMLPKGTKVYVTGVSEDKSFYWISKDDII